MNRKNSKNSPFIFQLRRYKWSGLMQKFKNLLIPNSAILQLPAVIITLEGIYNLSHSKPGEKIA
jgi:hypothetical protein